MVLPLAATLLASPAVAAEAETTDEPTREESSATRIQVSADLLGEFAAKAVGAEVRASIGLGPLVDVGAGGSIGSSVGILLTARFHAPYEEGVLLRPFAQLRAALHPATRGYGGGIFAGVLVDAGPGRFELGAAGHVYAPSPGYLPYAAFLMAGYELDVSGARRGAGEVVAARETTAPVKERTGKTLIRGAVHDVDDKPVPGATVTLRGATLARPLTHTGSTFNFPVEEGEYTLTAEAEGFYARGVHVSIATGEQQVFSLPLKPTAREQVVELTRSRLEIHQSIQFESKKARILPESFFILDAVADLLLRHPELKQVRVEGHTDNVGNAEVNQTLSENRAQSVVKYLVEAGVDPTRLQAQGFGASKPIADNKSESGRAKNRRVQFELVGR